MALARNRNRHRAVVIGGSMAGLLATRVLSDHYREVVLLERDALPAAAQQRRGVPQGRHTHGLLASGHNAIERFFPGISETLVNRGALSGDIVNESRWFFQGACLTRFPSGLTGLVLSRPLLEEAVRERVLALSNVRRRDGEQAQGLLVSPSGGRIDGVLAGGERIWADLVVDATGRGSRSPDWLESIGYGRPPEESVNMGLGYTTRMFRRRPSDLGGDIAVVIPPTPEGKRGGVMLAQEDERWTVTLISHFAACAPGEIDGFVEYARTLPAPFIHEVVRRAEPLGEPASARFPASVRRRYELMTRFPRGYIVFGDAICSFNPIYGQGMSVAALEAIELNKTLAADPENAGADFFRRAAKVVDIPWSVAAGNDLRMPEATGPRTLGVRIVNWYMSRLHRAAHHDPAPALAFHLVGNLLAPPHSILHPRIACRVFWQNVKRRVATSRGRDVAFNRAAAGGRQ